MKRNPKDMERLLGEKYAQMLKESNRDQSVHNDCKEVIQASLSVMEHYNRLALALQNRMPARAAAAAFF